MRLNSIPSVRLDIRRIGAVKEGDEVVGNETRVKVVKKTKFHRLLNRPNSRDLVWQRH